MAKPKNAFASFIPASEPEPEVVTTPLRIAPTKKPKNPGVKKLTIVLPNDEWLQWKVFAAEDGGKSLQELIQTTMNDYIRRRRAKRAE